MAQNFGLGVVEGGWRKGPWTAEEDRLLMGYVRMHGEGRWNSVARLAGLKRNGKSCRLRWVNYLRPDLKRGQITPHEESIIIQLHARWGNRWSTIARSLPGRTDNEIKNYWRTHFKKSGKSSLRIEKQKDRVLLGKQQQREKRRRQKQLPSTSTEQEQPQQEVDITKIVPSLLCEGDYKVSSASAGVGLDMVLVCPQVQAQVPLLEEQMQCLSHHVFDVDSSLTEAHWIDGGLWNWGGL
ncbi:hypothetical protein ACLOJK_011179 [Asimina triloba]